jgi:hypothetical protein
MYHIVKKITHRNERGQAIAVEYVPLANPIVFHRGFEAAQRTAAELAHNDRGGEYHICQIVFNIPVVPVDKTYAKVYD